MNYYSYMHEYMNDVQIVACYNNDDDDADDADDNEDNEYDDDDG